MATNAEALSKGDWLSILLISAYVAFY